MCKSILMNIFICYKYKYVIIIIFLFVIFIYDENICVSLGMALSVCQLIHHWNISTIGQTAMQFNTDYFFGTISRSKSLSIHCNNLMFLRWIGKKIFTDIHASQRMHPFLIPLSSITPMRLTSFGFSEISWQLLDEFLPLCWANKSLGFFSNSIIRSKFYFAQ